MQRSIRAAVLATVAVSLPAQSVNLFASRVVASDTRGGAGGGGFAPANALGRPGGATNVHSLGIGGSLTLGFDVVITDGPGADLLVAENPFASTPEPWTTFAEVAYVEVSSDGVVFARIPSRYTGPQVDPGAFSFLHTGHYWGLTGVLVARPSATDSLDAVRAGGDPIDLATLVGDPLVVSGAVNLSAITQVRLVDVRSGVDLDSRGMPIRDTGGGSADIDAVTVLNYVGGVDARGPTVAIDVPASGDFRVTIGDPDGFGDIRGATFRFAIYGIEVDPGSLFAITQPVTITPTSFTLALGVPLPTGFPLLLAVSLQDAAGHHCSAAGARL